MPPATAGAQSQALAIGNVHSFVPVRASIAHKASPSPTYSTPSATAGEDTTCCPILRLHTLAPVAASRALSLKAWINTRPPATAGEASKPAGYLQIGRSLWSFEGLGKFSYGFESLPGRPKWEISPFRSTHKWVPAV